MVGKFGVCMTVSPIRHALPHRQADVDTALYHELLRRIRGPLRASSADYGSADEGLVRAFFS